MVLCSKLVVIFHHIFFLAIHYQFECFKTQHGTCPLGEDGFALLAVQSSEFPELCWGNLVSFC